jgi:DNA modification methylase
MTLAEKTQKTFAGMEPTLSCRPTIKKERLPTNTTTYKHPVHRWYNFIAGFSPEFVGLCLDTLQIAPELYLDPFAGCATGPLAAVARGIEAVGYEPHPIMAKVARAKLPGADAVERLDQIEHAILAGLRKPLPSSTLPFAPKNFLRKLFPEESLAVLLGARASLEERGLSADDLAFLVLSKILDLSSHSQTDGIYKAPTSRKTAIPPTVAAKKTLDMVRHDLARLPSPYAPLSRLYEKSSEQMTEVADSSVDIVVTSPPYLNNFDFAEMTRMYLYFWGIAASWGEITDKVRSKLVVNTTTALKGQKEKQEEYRANLPAVLYAELDGLVSSLADQRKTRAGKKEYDYLVYPYFSQVTNVLRECYRCLKQGAAIHVMVADAALYGIHISTPQLLANLLAVIGFHQTSCDLIRKRGHRWILDKRDGSERGLGEYHVSATK